MRDRLTFLLFASLTVAAGCSSGGTEEATPEPHFDANAANDVDIEAGRDDKAHRTEVAVAEVREGRERTHLAFDSIDIGPPRVRVDDTIVAEAKLVEGASPFAEIEYTWFKNDVDLRSVQAPRLDSSTGRFGKGDVIYVVASAMDEHGGTAEITSPKIQIANSVPEIQADASRRIGINGMRMKATDADNDTLQWSILKGPPGVTIDASGRITVRQVDLQEGFDGEVIVAATDPEGARAEWHVPVTINAAREEVTAERTTTRHHTRDSMNDEEYEKVQLDSLDRVMGMSDEEFQRHTEEQERAEEELKRKK